MSYDISLYTEAFLARALATGLGDWTDADPIPQPAVDFAIATAVAEGFRPSRADSRAHRELVLDTSEALATLDIFRGQIAFSVPYGPRSRAGIDLCAQIARRVAAEHALSVWDPQENTHDDTSNWLEALEVGDAQLRAQAARMLSGRSPKLVAAALAKAARHDSEEQVRRCALEALGALGEQAKSTVSDVEACLVDPSPIIQYWATFALARVGAASDQAIQRLETMTQSSEPGPRYGALDALKRIRARS